MLDWLRYRYQLARLQREHRRIEASNHEAWLKAKEQNKSAEDLDFIIASGMNDTTMVYDEIAHLETRYLCSQAEKYLLPVPPIDAPGKWQDALRNEYSYLTTEGMMELRAQIRTERKERSELARSWLSGLTGLIGVLIGLLAIILGRR